MKTVKFFELSKTFQNIADICKSKFRTLLKLVKKFSENKIV